jgi:phosphoglycerol transferase MdoB-like AlkP superfamily enzyme
MDNKNNNTVSGGVGVCGLLGVAFIVLKLCKVINWSWWWVTAPFWIPIGISVLLIVLVGILAAFTKDE